MPPRNRGRDTSSDADDPSSGHDLAEAADEQTGAAQGSPEEAPRSSGHGVTGPDTRPAYREGEEPQ